jgi:hypothetical protein
MATAHDDSGTVFQTKRKQRWGEAGPGRPKGLRNKITLQQRHVAEMVLGKPGTPEFDSFVQSERQAILDGTMDSRIKTLWMHYLLGKPVDRVEVKEVEDDFSDLSAEHLRERSLAVARVVMETTPSETTH